MQCRFCDQKLSHVFIDLFHSPASNSFLSKEELNEPEVYFPLKVFVCQSCFLVQIDEYKKSDAIFNNSYVYFSSFSTSWLAHARKYCEEMKNRLLLNEKSLVAEVASNDGYLLQYFQQAGIPVLGIEPTANTAKIAQDKGIETLVEFFGSELAKRLMAEGKKADLLLGNNVLAHVPDIRDFVSGLKIFLAPDGLLTMEFPHLLQLVQQHQFDTIYHEHFSYLSFTVVKRIFSSVGLKLVDVEELPTHGGSLRIYATHDECDKYPVSSAVEFMMNKEKNAGMGNLDFYTGFQQTARDRKLALLEFLLNAAKDGKKVAAYGAAAKGNTFLNYAGIKADMIEFVADANFSKQGKFLPGSHLPVVPEEMIRSWKPDFVIIFPWNLQEEITNQLSYIREWGGKFVLAIPELKII